MKAYRLAKVLGSWFRPSQRRVELIQQFKEALELEAEIIANAEDTKRTQKIREFDAINALIFHEKKIGKSIHAINPYLIAQRSEVQKELTLLQAEYLKKLNDLKVIPELLRGETVGAVTDKDKLVMRDNEIKMAVLISHLKTQQFIRQFVTRDSMLGRMLEILLETRTAFRQRRLYMIVYSLLTVNEEILRTTHNPPLTNTERMTRINDFALLRFIMHMLLVLLILYISTTIYAYLKCSEAERTLEDVRFAHQKLILKYQELKISHDHVLQDYNYLIQTIDELKVKKATSETRLLTETDQEEYLKVQKEFSRTMEQLTILADKKATVYMLLHAKQDSLAHFVMQEKVLLAREEEAKKIIARCKSSAKLTLPVEDKIQEINGTFFQKPTVKEEQSITPVLNTQTNKPS